MGGQYVSAGQASRRRPLGGVLQPLQAGAAQSRRAEINLVTGQYLSGGRALPNLQYSLYLRLLPFFNNAIPNAGYFLL